MKRQTKRDHLILVADIIRACPDCLTHLMQKTNLTGNMASRKALLVSLTSTELISAQVESDSGLTQWSKTIIYRATEKGLRYARLIDEALELIGWDR